MPEDGDLSPLAQSSLGLHEHFLTLVEQGFTERQALHLIGVLMAELLRNNP
jgi:hypothetical protein